MSPSNAGSQLRLINSTRDRNFDLNGFIIGRGIEPLSSEYAVEPV